MSSESLVYVVEDDRATRESLALLLELAGYVVEAYDSALKFLDCAEPRTGACLVTDVRMPKMDGLALQQQLIDRKWQLPVIVVTGHGEVPLAVSAMKAGALDFFEKPFDGDALLAAVRRAIARSTRSSVSDVGREEILRRLALLSGRERQVYERVVSGKQSKAIAFELGTSPRTVEIHRSRMMRKMGAGTLQELVRMAVASSSATE